MSDMGGAAIEVGSAEWLSKITASKVAAILGLSPWESPRSLWDLMAGRREKDPQTDAQSRGHYLEEPCLRWFFDQHPEFTRHGGEVTVTRPDLPWAAATPDDVATAADGTTYPVDAKTDGRGGDWGEPGTDGVPPYYLAQFMWTMHLGGWDRLYVPYLGPFLKFEEYVVLYDKDIAQQIEAESLRFYESVQMGTPPEVDGSPATYESLRRVYPEIEDTSVEIPTDLARRLCTARTDEADAKAAHIRAKNEVLDLLGTAKKATCNGQVIAQRQMAGGRPSLYAPRTQVDLVALTNGAAA